MNVTDFLTRRPQTKRELAERMGITTREVPCGYCARAFTSIRGRSLHMSSAHPAEHHAEGAASGKAAERAYFRERKAQWAANNRERSRDQARRWQERNREQHRVANAEWRATAADHRREYMARWRSENREHVLEYAAERRLVGAAKESSPEARLAASRRASAKDVISGAAKARRAVRKALLSGKLTRLPCEACGATPTEGHHYLGYAPEHRLDVRWLCKEHHVEAHNPENVARRRRVAARLHRRATTIHDTATALAATAEKLAKREDRTLWGGRP